jgi:hypothetical protein
VVEARDVIGEESFPFATQPEQALENEAVLAVAGEGRGKLLVGLVLVINVVLDWTGLDWSD